VLVFISGAYTAGWINLPFVGAQVEAQTEAEEELDKKKPAVQWHVEYAQPYSEAGFSWELDRRLTSEEEKRLEETAGDMKKVAALLKSLGGRRVGDDTSYIKLQLLSDRDDPVSVTELTAKKVRCWESKAKTVVSTSEGGAESWEEFYFYFSGEKNHHGEFPAIESELGGDFKPYDKPISIGAGETPGYLKIGVESEESCEWTLKVKYNVGADKSDTVTIKDNNGKNFVFRIPARNPEDYWTVGEHSTFRY